MGSQPEPGAAAGQSDLPHTGRLFYPLAVGNRWDYAVTERRTLVTDAGPQPPQILHGSGWSVITGGGLDPYGAFFTEEVPDVDPFNLFILREDRTGLFRRPLYSGPADEPDGIHGTGGSATSRSLVAYVDRAVAGSAMQTAFRRAAMTLAARIDATRRGAFGVGGRPGAQDFRESAVLRYPLHIGARWSVGLSDAVERVVVAHERVVVPAGTFVAWKVRVVSELDGPNDWAYLWYSSVGLVRSSSHSEIESFDNEGNRLGRLEFDAESVLSGLHLVRPGASVGGP